MSPYSPSHPSHQVTEMEAQLAEIGSPLFFIGISIMLFGLFFPSNKEPILDDHSHSPLGSKYSDLNS